LRTWRRLIPELPRLAATHGGLPESAALLLPSCVELRAAASAARSQS